MMISTKTCQAFLAGSGRVGVVVLQEWWGLNEQMKGMAKKFADHGLMAIVPDLYRGRVAVTPDEASHLMSGLDWDAAIEDISSAAEALRERGVEKVATLGFCLGGALAIASACRSKGVDGAVCFYGVPPKSVCQVKDVKVPLQLHFGLKDCSTGFSDPKTAAELEAALKEHGKTYHFYRYDADHAFMNETRPEVYDPVCAEQAFTRSLEFIKSL